MTDFKTAADLEAAAVVENQAKEQADYAAKPACERCGHHPGDALHVCTPSREVTPEEVAASALTPDAIVSADELMAPGGILTVKEYEAALEVEGLEPPSKQDLIAKVNEWMPDATPEAKVAEAKRLIGRWMLLDLAYKAGLRMGRDLRERAKYGKGWMWQDLEPLSPSERTFVLGRVREKVVGREGKA